MSNLNIGKLGELIDALNKIKWWISAAIVTASAIILWLANRGVPLIEDLPAEVLGLIGVVGILFFCIMVFQAIDLLIIRYNQRIRRRFNTLSEQQREFLIRIFMTGDRGFKIYEGQGTGTQRWFEELMNWNYIERDPGGIWVSGMPDYYSITENGWEHIKDRQQQSK